MCILIMDEYSIKASGGAVSEELPQITGNSNFINSNFILFLFIKLIEYIIAIDFAIFISEKV